MGIAGKEFEGIPWMHLMARGCLGVGKGCAQTSSRIRVRMREAGCFVSDVHLRTIFKELVEFYGCQVGSSTSDPPGFYLIESAEEMEENVRSLSSRAFSILRRVAALKRIAMDEAYRQMKLDFGEVE